MFLQTSYCIEYWYQIMSHKLPASMANSMLYDSIHIFSLLMCHLFSLCTFIVVEMICFAVTQCHSLLYAPKHKLS